MWKQINLPTDLHGMNGIQEALVMQASFYFVKTIAILNNNIALVAK